MKRKMLVLLMCLTTYMAAQLRRGGEWEHLGNAHVDGRSDHDNIRVGGGEFTALQMGVTNGAIGFDRVVIHFRNGTEEVLPANYVVRSGSRTPPIPLRGGTREINNVEIWYAKSHVNEGKPRVDLFGRR